MNPRTRSLVVSIVGVFVLCWGSPRTYADILTVSGMADIFGAGHASPPSGTSGTGILPPGVSFAPGAGQIFRFSSVTGLVSAGSADGSVEETGPDGYTVFNTGRIPASTDISSINGISGLTSGNRGFFMVGVFLNNSQPADPAPPRLDFTAPSDFLSLAPLLNQSFFIGDGKTTGGVIQQFFVPSTATRLFLGFEDAADPANGFLGFHGPPGFYADNGGSLVATFAITPVPEPMSLVLLVAGIGMFGFVVRRSGGARPRRTVSPG